MTSMFTKPFAGRSIIKRRYWHTESKYIKMKDRGGRSRIKDLVLSANKARDVGGTRLPVASSGNRALQELRPRGKAFRQKSKFQSLILQIYLLILGWCSKDERRISRMRYRQKDSDRNPENRNTNTLIDFFFSKIVLCDVQLTMSPSPYFVLL